MRAFAGFVGLLVVFMLAMQSPVQAQSTLSLNQALEQQLATNGVADPDSATGEQLGAAIEALVANNPSLTAGDIENLVLAAVGKNPAGYQAIALSAAKAANSRGMGAGAIETILGTAISAAGANGIDTTGAADTLASAASTATGQQISGANVQSASNVLTNLFYVFNVADTLSLLLLLEENPAQDASPD
mgnify:CR=1 FL=1